MAVRQVSNRGGNIIGKFPSLKMGRMIAFESLIERDFIYLLEYAADVQSFAEQPLTLEYPDGTKIRHYTPDFHVVRAGRHELIECKPDKFVGTEDNQRKFEAAREWCRWRNWGFRVVTGEELRKGKRLENVKLLTQYARHRPDPTLVQWIYAMLADAPEPLTVRQLATCHPVVPLMEMLPAVLCLAFHHHVALPLAEMTLSADVTVTLPSM